MKKISLTLFLVLIGSCVFAQIQQLNNGTLNELVFFVGTNNKKYDEDSEGSRYLNESFLPARINDIKETQLVRFNVVENAIEIKDSNGKVLTLSNSYEYSIKFLDGSKKVYETHAFLNENSTTSISFFEKIHATEKFALFLKERIIYIPGKKSTSSYEQDISGKFKKGRTLFYITDLASQSTALLEVPKKRKNLSRLFKKQTKTLEMHMKKKALKLDRKEDLIKIVNFYLEQN